VFIWASLRRSIKIEGSERRRHCKNCCRRSMHVRIRTRKQVALYGLPLGEFGNERELVCSKCGAASTHVLSDGTPNFREQYAKLDPWDRVMVTPFKGRKLKKAAHRGRSKGLEAFQERYGASTVIDKRWLRHHRNEVRDLFYQALVAEITNAGLGLKEEEISTRVKGLADTVFRELKAAV
jgi:hypothetical protein